MRSDLRCCCSALQLLRILCKWQRALAKLLNCSRAMHEGAIRVVHVALDLLTVVILEEEAIVDVVATVVVDLEVKDVLEILVVSRSLVIILIKVMHPWR